MEPVMKIATGPDCTRLGHTFSMRLSGTAALVIAGLAAVTLTACGGQDNATPNLKGHWTGSYNFPTPTGPQHSALTLNIVGEQGQMVWGTEHWTSDGQDHSLAIRGSISPDDSGLVMALVGGFLTGTVGDNSLNLRFVITADPATSFTVTLTRK